MVCALHKRVARCPLMDRHHSSIASAGAPATSTPAAVCAAQMHASTATVDLADWCSRMWAGLAEKQEGAMEEHKDEGDSGEGENECEDVVRSHPEPSGVTLFTTECACLCICTAVVPQLSQ
jgi:hypothetical protein